LTLWPFVFKIRPRRKWPRRFSMATKKYRDINRRPEPEIVRLRLFYMRERNHPMQTPNQLSHPADNILSTEPLGAIYAPEKTLFRVSAPTAGKLSPTIY